MSNMCKIRLYLVVKSGITEKLVQVKIISFYQKKNFLIHFNKPKNIVLTLLSQVSTSNIFIQNKKLKTYFFKKKSLPFH